MALVLVRPYAPKEKRHRRSASRVGRDVWRILFAAVAHGCGRNSVAARRVRGFCRIIGWYAGGTRACPVPLLIFGCLMAWRELPSERGSRALESA